MNVDQMFELAATLDGDKRVTKIIDDIT